MKDFDIIIIGAGASGCYCALTAAKSNKKILLIDKVSIAGKKILVTGNGRCNITNLNIFPSVKYYNQNIDKFLSILPPTKTLDNFKQMGLICYADDQNRVYPLSNSAKSVLDVLNNQLSKHKNINLLLNTTVHSSSFEKEKYFVKTDNGTFSSQKLVIATGGATFEDCIKSFNIKIRKPSPSLVSLKADTSKSLEGIRLSPVRISVVENNKEVFTDTGEILFKNNGISGIVVFNISAYFARKNNFCGNLKLDLLPDKNITEVQEILTARKNLNLPINKLFDGLFLPQVGYSLLNKCKINENRTTNLLNNDEIGFIASVIKNFPIKIKSHYENNQVYSGGVPLTELNENLECKKQKNLYFCGEICDVDGLCGGYNLQWAWTSGYIVGENL